MSTAIVGVAILQFGLYFVVARYLGSDDYGSFAIALTMALLAAPLCDLGMNISVIYSHSRDPKRLPQTVGASLIARTVLAVPVGAAALCVGYAFGFGDEVLALFVPLFVAALLDGVAGLFSAVFQAKELMGWSSAILFSRNLSRVLGFSATLALGGDLWMLAISWLIASGASAGFAGLLVLRSQRVCLNIRAVPRVLRDAIPFGSAIIANLLLLQSDILMLGWIAGDASVGIYHAAFRFVVLAELLPQIISMVVIPRSYRIGHQEGPANLSRFYRVQTLALGSIGVLGSILLALHGGVIVDLSLGAEFEQSGVVLTALAPIVFLRFLLVPLGDALSSLGFQNRLSRAAWIAFGSNLVLNLLWIPTHGVLGAAAATCCSQVCMLFAQMWFARQTGLESNWVRLLTGPLVAVALAGAMFFAAPTAGPWLFPVAVLVLLAVYKIAPTEEHSSLSRASGR